MENIAIIFAGGSGVRMGAGVPKQFLEINGKPILIHTLQLFQEHEEIDCIYLAVNEEYICYTQQLLKDYRIDKVSAVVPGGETAQDSIYNALKRAAAEHSGDSVVLIHDGVRPFVEYEVISDNIASVKKYGSAITSTLCYETILISRDGEQVETLPLRKDSYSAQAPQSFYLKDILSAHEIIRAMENGYENMVDACTIYRAIGRQPHMVQGNRGNIKVTTPEDVYMFRALLQYKENEQAFGFGLTNRLAAKMNRYRGKKVQEEKKQDEQAGGKNMKRWTEDEALQEDLERITRSEQIDWEKLRGSRIVVTGATGLIGGMLVRALVCASELRGLNLKVVAVVRSREKAQKQLGEFISAGLELAVQDIQSPVSIDGPVDYVIHGAGMTASKDFVDHPVGTIMTALQGTKNLLEFAREKQVKSMVYLSSMEVYGVVEDANYIVREKDYGYIDPLQVRSSYSESKRMAEGLCGAYAHEYQVPVKTARLAQTFGAGVPKNENRVFAQFARSVMHGEDIVLHTDGSKAHCYCYTTDAVLGLLTILLKGENGEAYNVSNEATYGTIRQMAEMLIEKYPWSGSNLIFDIPEDANRFGYAPTSRMLVCPEKLNALGWKAEVSLPEMFERLIRSMRAQEE